MKGQRQQQELHWQVYGVQFGEYLRSFLQSLHVRLNGGALICFFHGALSEMQVSL